MDCTVKPMAKENKEKETTMSYYTRDKEYIANLYVMRCFAVTMGVYTVAFLLNQLGIFVIDKQLMKMGYFPSILIYLTVYLISKRMSPSSKRTKYVILFSSVLVFSIIGVSITYHVVLISLLPFLYATLYSSKGVLRYVYFLTVISTILIVYGGYFFGLCDANMALLTTGTLKEHSVDGQFILTQVNANPMFSLMLYYVVPRCLIYVAFMSVCTSIFKILNESLEKVKLMDELEQAKEAAEEANRAKTQFIARVSHEIRTPINAIMGMNEMIMRESRECDIIQYADDVRNSSTILLGIINELLDAAKIESGKMEVLPVEYDMGSFLNDLYHLIYIRAREKNLTLNFEIEKTIPKVYFGDDKRIRQVLINLLTNSVKYTDKGEVTLSLTAETEGDTAFLHFSVRDTGIGIKKEELESICEEFKRVDMKRNRSVEGTGLGMNIVQQLLRLMGSELKIESEYEKGSVFQFVLEQKIVDKSPLGDFTASFSKVGEEKFFRSSFVAPDARILVVDDYPMNIKVLKNLLKQNKVQIEGVESGRECLRLLRQQSFDLIFLDHRMPGMDGVETLHEMRKQELGKGVPVIMLTANAIVGDREKYLEEGFDEFLSKPIMPERLEKIMLQFLPEKYIQTANREPEEIVYMDAKAYLESLEKDDEVDFEQVKEAFPEFNYEKALSLCNGEECFYLELLRDFTELTIKTELEGYVETQDSENYSIRIHGFKNNAYSVGADKLGDLAYKMEQESKDGITEALIKKQEELFGMYAQICETYRSLL